MPLMPLLALVRILRQFRLEGFALFPSIETSLHGQRLSIGIQHPALFHEKWHAIQSQAKSCISCSISCKEEAWLALPRNSRAPLLFFKYQQHTFRMSIKAPFSDLYCVEKAKWSRSACLDSSKLI